ncbi:hypothetical protein LOTGIDRAFT_231739 [Lottia gigantea]|uniref:Uncharacterized protein n=1 Tax=Lottia gigantea TaxID=225164 RepID=V4C5S8_LOTGI|nr:hypothetical protein LOTGIDRAFT_231739 [Lottia gigantea]ESO96964.1 hypothetical protein LOTGIDRAFT_231739 [Lottia gigantea]
MTLFSEQHVLKGQIRHFRVFNIKEAKMMKILLLAICCMCVIEAQFYGQRMYRTIRRPMNYRVNTLPAPMVQLGGVGAISGLGGIGGIGGHMPYGNIMYDIDTLEHPSYDRPDPVFIVRGAGGRGSYIVS